MPAGDGSSYIVCEDEGDDGTGSPTMVLTKSRHHSIIEAVMAAELRPGNYVVLDGPDFLGYDAIEDHVLKELCIQERLLSTKPDLIRKKYAVLAWHRKRDDQDNVLVVEYDCWTLTQAYELREKNSNGRGMLLAKKGDLGTEWLNVQQIDKILDEEARERVRTHDMIEIEKAAIAGIVSALGPSNSNNTAIRVDALLYLAADLVARFPASKNGLDPRIWNMLLIYAPDEVKARFKETPDE